MFQILRRISRIAKSYLAEERDLNKRSDFDDDELKKIIDELNKSKEKNKEQETQESNQKMNKASAYRVIGVNGNANVNEIKSAFRKKMKEYHPDKTIHLSEIEKKLYLEKAKDIISAYEYLKKEMNF